MTGNVMEENLIISEYLHVLLLFKHLYAVKHVPIVLNPFLCSLWVLQILLKEMSSRHITIRYQNDSAI